MLPTGKRDKGTALQIVLYSIWTALTALIPVAQKTGALQISIYSGFVVGLLGLWLIWAALRLYRQGSVAAAKKLMLVSVSYLTLLQIIFIIDKYLIQ